MLRLIAPALCASLLLLSAAVGQEPAPLTPKQREVKQKILDVTAQIAASGEDPAAVSRELNRLVRPMAGEVMADLPPAFREAVRTFFTERIAEGKQREAEIFLHLLRYAVDTAAALPAEGSETTNEYQRQLAAALADFHDYQTIAAKIELLGRLEEGALGINADEIRELLRSYVQYAFRTQNLEVLVELLQEGRFRCREAIALHVREQVQRTGKSNPEFADQVVKSLGAVIGLAPPSSLAKEEAQCAEEILALLVANQRPDELPAALNAWYLPRATELAPVIAGACKGALRKYFTARMAGGTQPESDRFLTLFQFARDRKLGVVELLAILADDPNAVTAALKVRLLSRIDEASHGDHFTAAVCAAVDPYILYAIDQTNVDLLALILSDELFKTNPAPLRSSVRTEILRIEQELPNFAEAVKVAVGRKIGLLSKGELAEVARQEALRRQQEEELRRQAEMRQQEAERQAAMQREEAAKEAARRARHDRALAGLPAALAKRDDEALAACCSDLADLHPVELAAAHAGLFAAANEGFQRGIEGCPSIVALGQHLDRLDALHPFGQLDREIAIDATPALLARIRALPAAEVVPALDRIEPLCRHLENLAGTQGLYRLLDADLRQKRATFGVAQLVAAVKAFATARGALPRSLQELLPVGGAAGFVVGSSALWDPWAKAYEYTALDADRFRIVSPGPNGRSGDADDISADGNR